jgi:hypothetical protein
LAGAWVSKHFILVLVNFSITFDADMSYKIDCALGKTLGTFTIEEGKIFFNPTNSGINNPKANDIGSINIYAYEFIDENTLLLRGGRVSITLIRKEMHESKLNEQ